MRPSARGFVLDLLSTLRRGSMPVRALIAAGEILGIAENSVRVALARLLAAGQVQRDERGRYRLGAGAAPVERLVTGWRRPRTRRWGGGWIAVHAPDAPSARRSADGSRRAGRRAGGRERALRLRGFEWLAPGLAIRPDNLPLGAAELRDELRGLGLERDALVFALGGLDADAEVRARRLWDVAALRAGYRRSLAALVASEARIADLAEGDAMAETFRVGGGVIRQLVLDPLLPEEILETAERDVLVEALRRYDQLGRACWAPLLARFDVPHTRAPVDARAWQGATRLAAASAGGNK